MVENSLLRKVFTGVCRGDTGLGLRRWHPCEDPVQHCTSRVLWYMPRKLSWWAVSTQREMKAVPSSQG